MFLVCVFVCVCLCCKDTDQWGKLNDAAGDSCSLLSDITYKSHVPLPLGVRGHILKHVNETTVSDIICITSENPGIAYAGEEYCGGKSCQNYCLNVWSQYILFLYLILPDVVEKKSLTSVCHGCKI